MHRGYTKRWRKRWDKKRHKDRLLWVMMDYLIDHAAHEDKEVFMENYGIVKLSRGQCAYSYALLAAELFATPKQVRTRIYNLANAHFLAYKGTSRFTIITICNYDLYNPLPEEEGQAHGHAEGTPRARRGQQTNKLKELKELKEIYKWLDTDLWQDFRNHRKKLKSPLTEKAEKLILDKLEKTKSNGTDPNKYIETSIERGWKGVFVDDKPEVGKYGW